MIFLTRKNSAPRPGRGFTLIEILLTVTLVSLCSLAIYRVFAGGLKLWEYSQRSGIEEDVNIFFDKFSEDLRNAFYFKSIVFRGTESKIVVPTFVSVMADERSLLAPDGRIIQMGSVKYYYDYENHLIRRAQANYANALQERFAEDKILVKSIDSLKFTYFVPSDKGVEPYAKLDEVIPSSIYVEIQYSDGRSNHKIGRMIAIPVGL